MTQRRSGPIRSETARRSILTATGALIATRGYEHLTIEGVALEAGVGKQTIYRWWSSKSALVAESLLEGVIFNEQFTLANTGDLHADLVAWLDSVLAFLSEPSGIDLLRSLIAAAADDEEVGRRLRETLGGGSLGSPGGTSSIEMRLKAGIEASELMADAPVTEITEALMGAVIIRALSRQPVEPETATRLVRTVLRSNQSQ
jgi:AcrR family transcriptional regulator